MARSSSSSSSSSSRSVERVRAALVTVGLSGAEIVELDASTRTAVEAAAVVGCELGAIVKSLVFRAPGPAEAPSPAEASSPTEAPSPAEASSPAAASSPAEASSPTAVLALVSGDRRADESLVAAVAGEPSVGRADADFVRATTGFAIGGVAPVGHPSPLRTVMDEDLLRFDVVWAAAGSPYAVFGVAPAELARAIGVTPSRIAAT